MIKNFFLLVLVLLFTNEIIFAQWERVNNGLPDELVLSLAVKDSLIFAGITYSGIWISNDNGENWFFAQDNFGFGGVSCFAVCDSNIYAGTWNEGIYLSTDNGRNWKTLNIEKYGIKWINSIDILGNNIFAGTVDDGIYLTTNQGEEWKGVNQEIKNKEVRSFAVKGDTIFAGFHFSCGIQEGGLYRSIDKGNNWEAINHELVYYEPIWLLAINDNTIFAGNALGLKKSTDGGENWEHTNKGIKDSIIQCIAIIDKNIIIGTVDKLYLSTNDGTKWKDITSWLKIDADFISFAYQSPYVFVGIGTQGIYRAKLIDLITSVEEKSKQDSITLSICPNPFTNSLKIEFLNNSTSNVNIELYDILGNKIYTKNLGFLDSGTHNTTIKLNDNFNPGCYLVVVRTGTEIQSMKVIKCK